MTDFLDVVAASFDYIVGREEKRVAQKKDFYMEHGHDSCRPGGIIYVLKGGVHSYPRRDVGNVVVSLDKDDEYIRVMRGPNREHIPVPEEPKKTEHFADRQEVLALA
ncbi:MAG: hypothetical protein WC464_02455 [Bdellovibrionales bacterium]